MIDLIPTEDQQRIADSVAEFLADKLPVERHRRDHGRGASNDRDAWEALAALGVFGVTIPDSHGGIGLTLAEEALVFREFGRHIVSPAALGSVLAARLALEKGQSRLLAELLEGRRAAGLANRVGEGLFHLLDVKDGDLVAAWDDAGVRVYEASAFRADEARASLDPGVTLTRARLTGEPVLEARGRTTTPSGPAFPSGPALPYVASLLTAAMLVGIAKAARDAAVQQAQTRMQFNVPIGSFQAIKHKCADVALWTEAAWSQTAYAAVAMQAGLPEADFQAVNAKMIASSAALRAARENIQINGGMGFTAEINAHLFLKRTHVLSQLANSPRELQRKLLDFAPA